MPAVAADMAAGPQKPSSYIGKVASLLYARFLAGEKPIAMVSMDNCSHNGDKLAAAITAFAEGWVKNGLADEAFEAYVKTSGKVSFPWTMIDKITPRPDASIEEILKKDGTLEFKTDNKDLFDFSLDEMKNAEGWELTAFTYDLHHDVVLSEGNVMTEYEEKFSSIGNPICKMEARFL